MQSIMQRQLARHSSRNLYRSSILSRAFHHTPKDSRFVPISRGDSEAQSIKSPKGTHEPLRTEANQNITRRDEALPKQGPESDNLAKQTFTKFDLSSGVYIVTGGARGIGLAMAESLAEAGGEVYCFDRNEQPDNEFHKANEQLQQEPGAGQLHYRRVDITQPEEIETTFESIAGDKQRLDGMIAAAGINQVTPALDCSVEDARKMLDTNFIGVLATANACAKQMFKYRCRGSMCVVASMSGLVANKGMMSPVYNSSKAAVIQLARNLSMEWSKVRADGTGGIRVNALSPGHVLTPMVKYNFDEIPGVREEWEAENMMGRLADTSEFKGAALFLLSNASSFMTGNNLIIDGGHTAW